MLYDNVSSYIILYYIHEIKAYYMGYLIFINNVRLIHNSYLYVYLYTCVYICIDNLIDVLVNGYYEL